MITSTTQGRMEAEQGTLQRRHGPELLIRCTPHGTGFGRRPAYFELHDVPVRLDEDEVVTVRCGSAPPVACQVLDGSNICAVVATL
jgi:hypothetical protein